MTSQRKLIDQIKRICEDHKNKCSSWAGQPGPSVRAKILQHFAAAEKEITALVSRTFEDQP